MYIQIHFRCTDFFFYPVNAVTIETIRKVIRRSMLLYAHCADQSLATSGSSNKSPLTDLTVAAKRHEASPSEEHATKEPIQQQIHRMFLLRVKLMHFVNSLHNYIMTRVGFYVWLDLNLTFWIFKSHILLFPSFFRSFTAPAWNFSTKCRRQKIWTSWSRSITDICPRSMTAAFSEKRCITHSYINDTVSFWHLKNLFKV